MSISARASLPFLVLLLAAFMNTVGAQVKRFEVLLGAGIGSRLHPTEFPNGFDLGLTGKIAAGYFLTQRFAIGASVCYSRLGRDRQNLSFDGLPASYYKTDGGNLSISEIAGVGKYYFLPQSHLANFYIVSGAGLAFSKTSDLNAAIRHDIIIDPPMLSAPDEFVKLEGNGHLDFILTGGAGVTYNFDSRLGIFAEATYSIVVSKDNNTAYMPIRVGVRF